MGPPRERGGETDGAVLHGRVHGASMGPPRERGGESGRAGVPRADSCGFNGAAARTRRRAASIWCAPSPRRASMGPPRERGGESVARDQHAERDRASMGPPRERGGEPVRSPGTPKPLVLLQWGRRANAAERSGVPCAMRSSRWCFNGAAARTRRRAGGGPVRAVLGEDASMGPPRERGGESALAALVLQVGVASMGPPRERGGEASTPGSGGAPPVASMGPPRERGGEPETSEKM